MKISSKIAVLVSFILFYVIQLNAQIDVTNTAPNNPTSLDATYTNLYAGNYDITLTDINGCSTAPPITSVTIAEPLLLIPDGSISSNYTGQDIACFGESNGEITAASSGGTGVINYSIDGGTLQPSPVFSELSAGPHTIYYIDATGCDTFEIITLTDPPDLSGILSITQPISCGGYTDGAIEFVVDTINTGTPGYTYLWDDPLLQTTQEATGLGAGTYTCIITDTNACTIDTLILVYEPTDLDQIVTLFTSNYNGFHIACKGDNSGWLNLEIHGGYSPFTFAWNTGETTDSISNLYAGEHYVTVTDSLECWITITYILSEPPTVISGVISATTDYHNYEVRCYGNKDGAIEEIADGGVGDYTYQWNNGDSSDSIFNLFSGYYKVTVYDDNGCRWMDSIILNQPDSLVLSMLLATDTCEREVGYAEASLTGGVSPYTYEWSSGDTTIAVYDLAEGMYEVVTLDANLCEISNVAVIENLPSPKIDFKRIPEYKRFNDQINNPFIFVDVSDTYWQNVIDWQWDFGDDTFGEDSIVSHSYAEVGEYTILLAIETQYNCWDTISKNILIDEYELFIPNAFTPLTGDVLNDEFKPDGYGIKDFKMMIFNRWGEMLFESHDIKIGWNGTTRDEKNIAPIGVYLYYIEVENIYGEVIIYRDFLELLR